MSDDEKTSEALPDTLSELDLMKLKVVKCERENCEAQLQVAALRLEFAKQAEGHLHDVIRLQYTLSPHDEVDMVTGKLKRK